MSCVTNQIHIASPLPEALIPSLTVGTGVLLSGVIYVARDAAHKRMIAALDRGEPLPFDPAGQTLYYMGPSPARPGKVIGSAGPTTSSRMDVYTPRLLGAGIRAIIGKGNRSPAVRDALKQYRAVYLVTLGGAGALLSQTIKEASVIAYPDLGAEAVLRLRVADFPAVVANDIYGRDLFAEARANYQKK
jgi:fumarate hydratase subunit beta